MRSKYGGDEWHSSNVDIHHALLGGIGGGIAYIGVLCRSDWGFGLTGGLKGKFESIDEPVVWDMKSFMHEASDKGSNVEILIIFIWLTLAIIYRLDITLEGECLPCASIDCEHTLLKMHAPSNEHNNLSGHTHDQKYYSVSGHPCS